MTQKTKEDNEDARRERRRVGMAMKTETSPRAEAAPFSDRERVKKRKVKSNWGRSMLPSS